MKRWVTGIGIGSGSGSECECEREQPSDVIWMSVGGRRKTNNNMTWRME